MEIFRQTNFSILIKTQQTKKKKILSHWTTQEMHNWISSEPDSGYLNWHIKDRTSLIVFQIHLKLKSCQLYISLEENRWMLLPFWKIAKAPDKLKHIPMLRFLQCFISTTWVRICHYVWKGAHRKCTVQKDKKARLVTNSLEAGHLLKDMVHNNDSRSIKPDWCTCRLLQQGSFTWQTTT